MIKVLVVNPNKGFEVKEIENDIKDFYKTINCDCIDIATRRIGNNGKYYDIICDDEGLLKENPQVSAIDRDLQAMLVGNLIITNYSDKGETTSLTESDIDYLMGYCKVFKHKDTNELIYALTQVDY